MTDTFCESSSSIGADSSGGVESLRASGGDGEDGGSDPANLASLFRRI